MPVLMVIFGGSVVMDICLPIQTDIYICVTSYGDICSYIRICMSVDMDILISTHEDVCPELFVVHIQIC